MNGWVLVLIALVFAGAMLAIARAFLLGSKWDDDTPLSDMKREAWK
jgi:hypothetical protein